MQPYKHWWAFHPTGSAYAAAWPHILHDSIRIIVRAGAQGILICGPGGHGDPILHRRNGIHLGGTDSQGLHRQPLRVPAPHPDPNPSPAGPPPALRSSVDTGRLAYDAVVTAILLRCHLLLGNDFAIRSDGGWDNEWAHGAADGVPGARELLAGLIGPIPGVSPLTWRTPPIHHDPERHRHA